MNRIAYAVAALSGLALLAAAPPPANLLVNGGFEAPRLAAGTYRLMGPGQHIPGWTAVGARSGNVAVISGAYQQNGFRFPAAAGQQWLDLTGLSNTANGVSQTVKTKPGEAYVLSFAVGNIVDASGTFGVSSTVEVQVNGKRLMTAVNDQGAGGAVQAWKPFSTRIVATSAKTTITFLNRDPPNDNTNGLDDVSLVPAAP